MSVNKPNEEQLNHLLNYNIEQIYPQKDFLRKKLISGEKLTIYFGADPTRPDIHLGHATVLRKLREFQDLGHQIIFLLGDFTAKIGDPTGKSKTRPVLTEKEIQENAQTYQDQISLLVDFEGDNPAQIMRNSQWLTNLNFTDLLKLSSEFTVQQMLERDMFQERIKNNRPIYLHEFLYPLMQAYDSCHLKVDIEIGGTDQTFNMLTGRDLMKNWQKKEKIVITCPLLVGTDGQKMSKSLGNTINLTDKPHQMYGKLMSLQDELILIYLKNCTDFQKTELDNFAKQLEQGENPMEIKKVLAFTVTKMYHGVQKAETAEKEFVHTVQEGNLPSETPHITLKEFSKGKENQKEWSLIDLVMATNLTKSKAQAKRLISQGGIEIDGLKALDPQQNFPIKQIHKIRVGKRKGIILDQK